MFCSSKLTAQTDCMVRPISLNPATTAHQRQLTRVRRETVTKALEANESNRAESGPTALKATVAGTALDPELPFEPKPSQRPLSSSNSHRKFRGERQTIGQTGPQELGQQRPLYTVFRTDSASFPASANADVKKADRRCASSAGESVQEVHLRLSTSWGWIASSSPRSAIARSPIEC